MLYPKSRPMRSESYRRWVASRPCIACGVEGFSQAAHSNHGKGLGIKACDSQTFPLCAPHWGMPGCHWQHDNMVDMTREQRRDLEARYVQQTKAAAEAEGWGFNGRIRKAVCRA